MDEDNIERWDPSSGELPYLTRWFERGRVRVPNLQLLSLDPGKIQHADFNPDNWSKGNIGNVRSRDDKNRRFDAAAHGDKDGWRKKRNVSGTARCNLFFNFFLKF